MENTQLSLRLNSSTLSRPRPFPPRRDFASLSMLDLIEAREAYHVYLSGLENVVATAIGRFRFHKDDWYAEHPPDASKARKGRYIAHRRTLNNSIVRPWSWPAVMVFVREWEERGRLGNQSVPRWLYLPDGRVIPTCVILATPDETPPPPVPGPSQASGLFGGGYSCLREHQGVEQLGSIGCLVYREGSYYALTNRHVAGSGGDEVRAFAHGDYHRIGISADLGITRLQMSEIFPNWPVEKTFLTLDAGLIRLDNFDDWTSQVFGIGEVGATFDATEQSMTLDLIGCPVRAFGGTSGVIEGEIQALFFRYESLGGFDYATDVLIGPQAKSNHKNERRAAPPFTRPGDSGTIWFYDPPPVADTEDDDDSDDHDKQAPEDRGLRARRLRPIAMQWGGQRFKVEGEEAGAFALGSFLSTICRALDVEVVRNWSTGHDEYWGKLGHFAIGFKACDELSGNLKILMTKNQERIGFGDATLGEGSAFKMGAGAFIPLADVPDYAWIMSSRDSEPIQHFADVDVRDIDGGPTMLDRCFDDPKNVSAQVWKKYFDGFAAAKVGPEEGVLPFRVWQIWEAMVAYLKENQDVIHFVAAAGVLAHYVGDASQPMHCSYLHHGIPPMKTVNGRKYPFPRSSPEFEAFKKTREAKIHGIYEETMLEIDTPAALIALNKRLTTSHL
ncbi:MAG TPA: hypothetical protein VGO56_13455 [Pyrinomonadaceae bacterium]|jgi:hypothetical protein|nr:hypothetical protein [Pyrinomonadaceae bacterium]